MTPEFALINRYFNRPVNDADVALGIGDDCALLRSKPGVELAISTDTLGSGTHFFPDAEPEKLGTKALAVNLSDLAAMGATPRFVMLSLTFWGALWGLTGMFLSTPLTVLTMVILAQFNGSRWIAILLSADGDPQQLGRGFESSPDQSREPEDQSQPARLAI